MDTTHKSKSTRASRCYCRYIWRTVDLKVYFFLSLTALLLRLPVHAQSRDIRVQATYGSDSEAPRSKWEYYHDMWSERDVKHGRYSEWISNDKLCLQGYYFDDLQDSLWQYWYTNGQIREVSEWEAGKRQGKTTLYDRRGKTVQECTYKGDIKEGLAIDYYPNGRVRQVAQYHSGRMHGNVTTYTRKGIRKQILQYNDGKRSKAEKELKEPKDTKEKRPAKVVPEKPYKTDKPTQEPNAPKKEGATKAAPEKPIKVPEVAKTDKPSRKEPQQ